MPDQYLNQNSIEDVSGQAGWMFSDMLVALMVVFLATISFIPQYIGGSGSLFGAPSDSLGTGGAGNTYTYSEHFDQVYVKVYETSDVSTIVSDIRAFLKQNGIPTNAVIDSSQFVGGYVQDKENSSLAIQRATEFSTRLERAYPDFLTHASTVLSSSPQLAPNLVTVRFTFSAQVTVSRD